MTPTSGLPFEIALPEVGPWLPHALVAILFLTGAVLWLVGRRVLRPLTIAAFAGVGAGLTLLLFPIAGLDLPLWAYALAGLTAGAGLGAVWYRFAMAAGLALTSAAAAPLLVAAVIAVASSENPGVTGPAEPHASAAREPIGPAVAMLAVADPRPDIAAAAEAAEAAGSRALSDAWHGFRSGWGEGPQTSTSEASPAASDSRPAAIDRLPPQLAGALDSGRAYLGKQWDGLSAEAERAWFAIPAGQQVALVAAAFMGAVGGLAIGLMRPGFAAGVFTAAFGPLLMLPGAAWAGSAAGIVDPAAAFAHTDRLLLLWAVAIAVGLGVQSSLAGRGQRAGG